MILDGLKILIVENNQEELEKLIHFSSISGLKAFGAKSLIDAKMIMSQNNIDIINKCCKYKHENNIKPYTIFQTQPIYANELDYNKIEKEIGKIINYMEAEINNYNYLPHNFLFIFPFLK